MYSCGKKEVQDSGETSLKSITFEKLDSIKIDYLGNPTVHDIDPVTETVLFMEHREFSEEIFLANFEGQLRTSFSKMRDVPDSYGGLMSTLRIDRDSSFIAYGYNGFLRYDFRGKLQSRIKLKEFQAPNFTRKAMGFGMEKLGDKYLYVDQGSQHLDYSSINVYEKMNLMNLLDPDTGVKKPLIQFPENSIFRSGKYFFRDSWTPAFSVSDDLIYVAFGVEPVIYLYQSYHPYSLVSSIPLDLPCYQNYKGTDRYVIDLSLWETSGKIDNIKRIDGPFVVAYSQGYNEMDLMELSTNKLPEESRDFRQKMREKYPSRIAILDSLGHLVSDFDTKGMLAQSMLVRSGELWMMEKPDEEVEKDYFRVFRVGLKVVE
ncbi:hypothetical protein GCM10027284_24270 [Cyclobacterium sediminis]